MSKHTAQKPKKPVAKRQAEPTRASIDPAAASAVAVWWRDRLALGVSAMDDVEGDARDDPHWVRLVGLDSLHREYAAFCRWCGADRLSPDDFAAAFEPLLPPLAPQLEIQARYSGEQGQQQTFRVRLARKSRLSGRWEEFRDDRRRVRYGARGYRLPDLGACRDHFAAATGERGVWDVPEPEAARAALLGKIFAETTVPLWWWWKLRCGHSGGEPWNLGQWCRHASLGSLGRSYFDFCQRHGLEVCEGGDFDDAIRALLPGRRAPEAVFWLDYCTSVQNQRQEWETVWGRWPERGLLLPDLDTCRAAFRRTAKLDDAEWVEGVPSEPVADANLEAVDDWWAWKLAEGVTAPDERDPWGQERRHWNRLCAVDRLLQSYRAFSRRAGRAPLDDELALGRLLVLLPPTAERVKARLFRQAAGEWIVVRRNCIELPDWHSCRDAFSVQTGRLVEGTGPVPTATTGELAPLPARELLTRWWRALLARTEDLNCYDMDKMLRGPLDEFRMERPAVTRDELRGYFAMFLDRHAVACEPGGEWARFFEEGALLKSVTVVPPEALEVQDLQVEVPGTWYTAWGVQQGRLQFEQMAGESVKWPPLVDGPDELTPWAISPRGESERPARAARFLSRL